MRNATKKNLSLLQLLFGTVILGLSLNTFLIPYKIAPGGVSGIATVLFHISDERIPAGIAMLVLNVPLFGAGLKTRGKRFIFRSLVGAVVLSTFVDIAAPLISRFSGMFLSAPGSTEPPDLLLYALAGGFTSGIGLGFVLKEDATTGGTDMGASLLNKIFPWIPVGKWLIILDGLVILLAAVAFKSFRLGLYSVVGLFVSARTLDGFLEGINFSKSLMIISQRSEEIAEKLIQDVERGVTGIHGRGMYTMKPYMLLLCVVKKEEIHKVKNIVKKMDPNAFVLLTDVREVLGEGFIPHDME